jgi:hypothetical protein
MFKNNIKQQIDSLPIDEKKKNELNEAISDFYNNRPSDAKPELNDFKLTMEDELLILTSHN